MTSIPPGSARLHYIPLGLFLFFPFAFLLCYFIAVTLSHINAFFAFVSDAGTLPPEQNVFAQLMNMGAALFAYFVYIRFKQIEHFFRLFHNRHHHMVNVVSTVFGFISALGMSIVANFPELVEMEVHLLGAFLAFVGGSFYILFQGYLTFKMLPHFTSKFIAYLRTFLGILGVMMYFGAHSTLIMAFEKTQDLTRYERKGVDILKWDPKDKGYSYRAASVVMEWIIVAIFDIFIVTFTAEFKTFCVEEPRCTFLYIKVVEPEPGEVDVEVDEETGVGAGDGEMGDIERKSSNSVCTNDLNDDDDEDADADGEIVTPIQSSEVVVSVEKLERVVIV